MDATKRVVKSLLFWLPISFTISKDVFSFAKIEGLSMQPTLNDFKLSNQNELVIIEKWRNVSSLKNGDIICFKSPFDSQKVLIKRITANEGELISNDNKLHMVPKGHLWVEGDNRLNSIDSKTFGPISKGLYVGNVRLVVWPINKIRIIK